MYVNFNYKYNHKNMSRLTKWKALEVEREDNYIIKLTNEFPLIDVTTDRQQKNGTRMFEISSGEFSGHRFATYHSGMVRKIIRSRFNDLSCYQLNPVRKSIRYWMGSDMEVQSYPCYQRVPIYKGINRLMYLKEYLIKNYDLKPIPSIVEVNGIYYKKL
jgi:hypothetical protein